MTAPVTTDASRVLGFWTCWSLTVGIMIGSGIFLLPSVLAPYGLLSFGGWTLTALGSIALCLVLGRLAARTTRSGGVYVYAHDAFGDLAGFLIAWGYWGAYWIAMPAMAIAFVGYLGVFLPQLDAAPVLQAAVALALIWVLTLINFGGVREAGFVQLAMTLLKLVPLLIIIGYGALGGDSANLPAANPAELPLLDALAATALLTMWAFAGLEAGTIPAGEVKNPRRTVPLAIVSGTLTVAFVYIASTLAVMVLVSADDLAGSSSPFADAAAGLGPWGPGLIAVGAMISTAGALNGTILVAGQLPMAVALDGLAPSWLARSNRRGAPSLALLLSGVLATALLLANYVRSLIEMFTFLIMMSTAAILVPLLVSALAELRHSRRSARGWAGLAGLAALYSTFTILGSGLEVIVWGAVLFLLGLPVYYLGRRRQRD